MKYILKRKTVKYDLFGEQIEELESDVFDTEQEALAAMITEHNQLFDFAKQEGILAGGKLIMNSTDNKAVVAYADHSYDEMEIVGE